MMNSSIKTKLAVVIVCALVLAGAALYGLPYCKIYRTIAALQEQDKDRLDRYIDFPQLKTGLKGQIRTAITAAGQPGQAKDMEKVRQAMMAQAIDSAVDQMITPEGLVSFFVKNLPGLVAKPENPSGRQASPESYGTMKIFGLFLWHTDCAYASMSEFVVKFSDEQDQSVRFVLMRSGLDWRLSRIEVSLPGKGNAK